MNAYMCKIKSNVLNGFSQNCFYFFQPSKAPVRRKRSSGKTWSRNLDKRSSSGIDSSAVTKSLPVPVQCQSGCQCVGRLALITVWSLFQPESSPVPVGCACESCSEWYQILNVFTNSTLLCKFIKTFVFKVSGI